MKRSASIAASFIMSVLSLAAPATRAIAAELQPPATEQLPVREKLHGVDLVDEYRWLEGSDAPGFEGDAAELDRRVSVWTDAQNEYTRQVLDHLPGRSALEDRLRTLLGVDQVAQPEAQGDRAFFYRRVAGQDQWTVVCRRADGQEAVILDPNALDPSGLTALGSFDPSPDGKLAAFTLFKSGDELTTLYLLDVDRGVWLAEEIPGRVDDVFWLEDGSAFLYHRLEDVKNPYSGQIRFHEVGTHYRQDAILAVQDKEGPLATTWGPFAKLSPDGRWLLLGYWTSTDANDLWVVDFDRWRRTGELERVPILVGKTAKTTGQMMGDTLYLYTNWQAPTGRIVAVDLNHPSPESWKEIVPERPGAVLEKLSLARGFLAVQYLENAASRLLLFRLDGSPAGEVELPGIGSASLSTNPDRTTAFLSFESFDRPTTIYQVDLKTGRRDLWAEPKIPLGKQPMEVHQVWYPSKDGTAISMFLVHRKGLAKDGDRPTLLSGYGGFGVSITPSFHAALVPWLEAGGLLAIPNLRGGGEYGLAWHQAGMLEKKQTVFDDFIAAARWLVAQGYTRPERLAARGGSNGGLLTGAVLVEHPELFAAVVSAVPLLDMLRYQYFLMARFWVPEYGSSENEAQFPYLLQYSPYQNVKAGIPYPGVLLTAGENDRRVHPLHARKMAARLQAATTSSPREHPVLLWVDRSSGHGRGKPLDAQVEEKADELIFLLWQLGMTPQGQTEAAGR
jgi:prolyl oligopeptidase